MKQKHSIIEDIFYNDECEWGKFEDTEHFIKYEGAIEELRAKLSPELFEIVGRMIEAGEAHLCNRMEMYYIRGFKSGFRLAIECLG